VPFGIGLISMPSGVKSHGNQRLSTPNSCRRNLGR
jgi:hypothetical protein